MTRISVFCSRIDARRRPARLLFAAPVLVAILTACATQPAAQQQVPGFAAGLLHGFIAILALAASLYFHVRIYAFPNSGFWYDAGFVLGFALNIVLVFLWILPKIGGMFTRGH